MRGIYSALVGALNNLRRRARARQTTKCSNSFQSGAGGLRHQSPLVDRASRSALTRTELISRVAEALCREWHEDLDDRSLRDARFWDQFMHEARVAVDAYLDALDEADSAS